jgi:CubicO group peptidase (beta-lactamase class C family)
MRFLLRTSRVATRGRSACLTLLLLSLVPLCAQDFSALEAVVKEELAAKKAPGAAIAVVQGDRVVHVKGYGVANVETGAAVSPSMLFRMGSTTKMFTAATLVSLALEGKVDLNAPVGKYVAGLHPKVAALTGNQLLSHTAGLWDEAPMFGPQEETALGEGIRKWTDSRFFTEPGRVYSYSNPGFWLAGFVSEVVAGKPYADVVGEKVFAPLRMTHSTFRPTMAMTHPFAVGHEVKNGKPEIVRPLANNASGWPAGSMFSSVEDLSRWVIAFLNEGKLEGKQVLPAALVREMSVARTALPNGTASYGYGLQIAEERGIRTISHGGSRAGYGSMIRIAPSKKTGVIVLVNSTGESLPRTVNRAWEIALGLASEEKRAEPAAIPVTEVDAKSFAGVYVSGPRKITVSAKNGALVMDSGERSVELVRVGADKFRANGMGEVTFVKGANGKAEYVFMGGRTSRRVN